MSKQEIKRLQRQLNEYLSNDTDYSVIYDLSVQLDKLIIEYYRFEKVKSLNQ